MSVPLLISADTLDHPIVGYSVIEGIVKNSGSQSPSNHEEMLISVLSSIPPNAKQENVAALISFIRTTSSSELCSVKVTKRCVVAFKV